MGAIKSGEINLGEVGRGIDKLRDPRTTKLYCVGDGARWIADNSNSDSGCRVVVIWSISFCVLLTLLLYS